MNTPSNTPPSKGMMMIAAYRAARLNQRPVLRTSLHKSHLERRIARSGTLVPKDPVETEQATIPMPGPVSSITPETTDPRSIFANLVSLSVAEQTADAAVSGTVAVPEQDAAEIPGPEVMAQDDQHATEDSDPVSVEETPQAALCADQTDMTAPPPSASPEQSVQTALDQRTVYDPPLAEIGFGPGMLIRLSQLGLYTTGDLAQADAGELRVALGDISRLVDVEAWIVSAQQTTSAPSA